jgi:transcriptional regulator with XRE-family HTH domain
MLAEPRFLDAIFDGEGRVAPEALSAELGVTRGQLASVVGLSRDAVSKRTRLASRPTQQRLRELAEIVNQVRPWAGSVPQAFAWYRSQPLPGFGDRTAETLVRDGHAEAVKAYLNRIAAGGYA